MFTLTGPVNSSQTSLIIEHTGDGARYSREQFPLEEGLETVREWDTHIVNSNNNPTALRKSRLISVKEEFEKWVEALKRQNGGRRKQTLYRKKAQKRPKTRKAKRRGSSTR